MGHADNSVESDLESTSHAYNFLSRGLEAQRDLPVVT